VFLTVCVVGSLLYSWHVDRVTEQELERHDLFLQERREKQNTTRPVKAENGNGTAERIETPTEQETNIATEQETPEFTSDSESVDAINAFLPDAVATSETPAEEVPVSPFGFGPYPEIPEGYPLVVSWTRIEEHREKFNDHIWRDLELMERVLIKLYNEGDTSFTAGIVNDGLVLPIYPNVAYVRIEKDDDWKSTADPLIDVRSDSSRILAGSNVSEADKEQIRKGKIPPGIEIRSFSDGIDPFTFLNLPQTQD